MLFSLKPPPQEVVIVLLGYASIAQTIYGVLMLLRGRRATEESSGAQQGGVSEYFED